MQHGSDAKRQETICELIQGPKFHGNAKLPNQPFFRPPMPFVAALFSPLLRILPNFVFTAIYHNWPAPQLNVLRGLLRSPTAIYACLTLADEEMKTIMGLEEELMNKHQHKLWLYFAEHDDWVGDSREVITKAFHPDHEAARIVRGEADIPHAFCISKSGSACRVSRILSSELKIMARSLRASRSFGYKRVDSCERRPNHRCVIPRMLQFSLSLSTTRRVQQ